jgi:hypothetical protein
MKNDGGPAFPGQWSAGWDKRDGKEWHDGMTLRDYFAAKAMQSLLSRKDLGLIFQSDDQAPSWDEYYMYDPVIDAKEILGKLAYKAADAMLAAREVKP